MSGVTVVLASGSSARRAMLERAGVPHRVETAAVDEDAIKAAAEAEGLDVTETALVLAEAKALRVAARHPDALVIGADQMLVCDDRRFDKPASLAEARAQLTALRGRCHTLVSAAVAVRGGRRVWHGAESARLAMRAFSDGFLESYLAATAAEACSSVGAYRIEERGAQLFSVIEGDHFVILGLPLLPLLAFLRDHGVLES